MKKFEEGTVVSMRLITGQEILAKFLRLSSEGLVLNRPVEYMIVGMDEKTGMPHATLAPILFSADTNEEPEVEVCRSNVLFGPFKVQDSLAKKYTESVSGLSLA